MIDLYPGKCGESTPANYGALRGGSGVASRGVLVPSPTATHGSPKVQGLEQLLADGSERCLRQAKADSDRLLDAPLMLEALSTDAPSVQWQTAC